MEDLLAENVALFPHSRFEMISYATRFQPKDAHVCLVVDRVYVGRIFFKLLRSSGDLFDEDRSC